MQNKITEQWVPATDDGIAICKGRCQVWFAEVFGLQARAPHHSLKLLKTAGPAARKNPRRTGTGTDRGAIRPAPSFI